jgi:hypothetical protein
VKTIRIQFESSKTEYCQPPEAQTPFTNKPIKSQQQQHNIDGGTNTTINMKRAKTAHVPLAFVPLSLVFEGGWFHPPGAVDLLMVVVDMVDVDVDGFRCVKK